MGGINMPKIRSYEKESSDLSNLLLSLTVGIVVTTVAVFLLGLFAL
jgi:hypothetical protein